MKALIIIDIQNDYFPGGEAALSGAIAAAKKTKMILEKIRNQNLPVFHIQHIATRKGATFFLPETEGVKINDLVKPIESEIIIKKNYPNSFKNTNFLTELKSAKINNLVICGMMTHMCIDATTRAAFDLDFNCTLIHDACATKDLTFQDQEISALQVHNAFLAALNGIYATLMNAEEYLRL